MKSAIDVFNEDKKHYLPVFNRYEIVLESGSGAYVYDINGKKYLDFLAGIAVNVLGYNHPVLIEAINKQAEKLIHISNLYYTTIQAETAKQLAQLTGMDKVFFANSGAEANEGAIKAARKYGHNKSSTKGNIITAWNSFHGRTIATLTATGQKKFHKDFGPLPIGFDYVDFGDIKALEKYINQDTAAVMLEPIQGEGGVVMPDNSYLQEVRRLCDEYDALLIFDEIQTGMGRCGKFLAGDLYGVKPDVITLAKGLAGGVPIGAFMVTDKVSSVFQFGDHGSTFGGNPLACAAAKAVLDVIGNDSFLMHVEDIGLYFQSQLSALKDKYDSLILSIRGKGLLLGAELNNVDYVRDIVNKCLEQGLIINCTAGNILRFVPPLIINKKEVDECIGILDNVFSQYI